MASWLGVAVGGCSSCGGGLGSVVLGAGSGVSAGLGAGGGVDGLVAGLSSGSMATGGWMTGAWMGASTGWGGTTGSAGPPVRDRNAAW
jgi:hypothetical protein